MIPKTTISKDYIAGLVDGEGCFDLQFRRDIRHERPGSPVYYGWKTQFVINLRKDDLPLLEEVKEIFQCGTIHFQNSPQKETARYSVQDLDNLYKIVVPFFRENQLRGKKQKDFELWAEAVEILSRNKNDKNTQVGKRGFTPTKWERKDFQRLVEVHREMQPYKAKRKQGLKWISAAEAFALTLPT